MNNLARQICNKNKIELHSYENLHRIHCTVVSDERFGLCTREGVINNNNFVTSPSTAREKRVTESYTYYGEALGIGMYEQNELRKINVYKKKKRLKIMSRNFFFVFVKYNFTVKINKSSAGADSERF